MVIERRWPLREVLLACIEAKKRDARADFRHAELLWQIRATAVKRPGRPPTQPAILKDKS